MGSAFAVARNRDPLGGRVLVLREKTALAKKAVERLRCGDERKAQYVSPQILSVFAVELAQRHQIDRDNAFDRTARDHTAVVPVAGT